MTGSNSTHYRFAANLGVSYEAGGTQPYGGFRMEIPVAVINDDDRRLTDVRAVEISQRELAHLRMFAIGAYQPLAGFMEPQDILSVVQNRCLSDFLPWESPVALATSQPAQTGEKLILTYQQQAIAQLTTTSCEQWTSDTEVHGIAPGDYVVGGDLVLFLRAGSDMPPELGDWNRLLDQPADGDQLNRHTVVVGLEPWRTDDEHLIRSAVELSGGVLLHPVNRPVSVGKDRLPAELVRQANELVLQRHYPNRQLKFSPVPTNLSLDETTLLQLGIIYQNLGCKHLLVVSESRLTQPEEWSALDIGLLLLQPGFHCVECGGHATRRLCVHEHDARSRLEEARIVDKLVMGEQLPTSVARPEVARLLSRQLSVNGVTTVEAIGKRHIFPHASRLTGSTRQHLNGHRAAVLWMTGLSGSGKSTLATQLEKELVLSGHQACVLDGDSLRNGLCSDLGFSPEARKENLRRAAETASLLMNSGMLVLASFISPFSAERQMLRDIIGKGFLEVYVEATLADCEKRDPKGLYQRARAGVIPEFTGVSSPYEEPVNPDMRINTSMLSVNEAVRQLLFDLGSLGLLRTGKATVRTGIGDDLASSDSETVRRN